MFSSKSFILFPFTLRSLIHCALISVYHGRQGSKLTYFAFRYSVFTTVFLNFIYFNWGLITLLYCSGFCHTLTWISHGCTCVPHPEPPLPHPSSSHPPASSQCTSSEQPVSCIKSRLVICFTYDNLKKKTVFFFENHFTI